MPPSWVIRSEGGCVRPKSIIVAVANAFTPADTVAIVAPQIAAINKPGSGDGR